MLLSELQDNDLPKLIVKALNNLIIFFKRSKHYFTLFLTIKYLCIVKILDLSLALQMIISLNDTSSDSTKTFSKTKLSQKVEVFVISLTIRFFFH